MRLPKMTETERLIFAACYANELERHPPAVDNSNAEQALEAALWSVHNFRQALRERHP